VTKGGESDLYVQPPVYLPARLETVIEKGGGDEKTEKDNIQVVRETVFHFFTQTRKRGTDIERRGKRGIRRTLPCRLDEEKQIRLTER